MNKIKRILIILMSAALLFVMVACGSGNTPQPQETAVQETVQQPTAQPTQPTPAPVQKVELTISAAASLKDAMEEIKTAYAKEKSNVTITYNFGASGSLQQQIEQGADVDLFLSAAAKQMDALRSKGLLLDDTRKNLLGNRLVLVIPNDSTAAISDFNRLTDAGITKIALGEPKSVPAGQYGEEVLTKLGIIDTVKDKFAYGKDVKTVLTWVETGDADAGIVYETDAKISDKVKVVAVAPEESHTPIIYPAAVLKGSKKPDAAKDFINYLYSDKAKPIFEKYGFTFLAK